MFKAVSRVLVTAIMLVAFVGQAIAFNTSMSCKTTENTLSHSLSEPINHFDEGLTHTDTSEDCCGIECCDDNCTCIANACSSAIYFNTVVDSTKSKALSDVIDMPQCEQPKSISTLLYRPPIFIS